MGPKLLILYAFLIGAPSLWASLFTDSYDIGPYGVSMAGAVSATVSDSTSAFYNVAGFLHPHAPDENPFAEESTTGSIWDEPEPLRHPHSFFDLSYTRAQHSLNILVQTVDASAVTAQKNAALSSIVDNYGIIQFGFAFDLWNLFSALESFPIVFGTSIAIPDDGTIIAWNDINAQDFNFVRYGRNAKKMDLAFALVMQPWLERLSIGVGTQLAIGSHDGLYRLREADLSLGATTQSPNNDVLIDYKPALQLNLGLQYRQPVAKHQFYFGATFRTASKLSAEDNSLQALNSSLSTELSLNMSTVSSFSPERMSLSLAYEMPFGLVISTQFDQYAWSKFPRNSNRTSYETEDLGFSDVAVYRAGLSMPFNKYSAVSYKLNLGIAVEETAVTEQTGAYNFLDSAKKKIGVGLEVTIAENNIIQIPTTIIASGQFQLLDDRNNIKASPDLTKRYNDVDTTTSGNIFAFSLGLSWPLEHEE